MARPTKENLPASVHALVVKRGAGECLVGVPPEVPTGNTLWARPTRSVARFTCKWRMEPCKLDAEARTVKLTSHRSSNSTVPSTISGDWGGLSTAVKKSAIESLKDMTASASLPSGAECYALDAISCTVLKAAAHAKGG